MHPSLMFIFAGLMTSVGAAAAMPAGPAPHADGLLIRVAGACFGGRPIPTEAKPLLDAKRIAQMRAAGQLPDSFVCGRCRYDLGGDPGAAWYVKTCK
jgi:hypothetical protein